MPRRKKMSLQDVIRIGQEMKVAEIEIDGMKVVFREPEVVIPEEPEKDHGDMRERELRELLHSVDVDDSIIKRLM